MAKGLSLKNIQKELDFKKWNISQIEKQDMSGRWNIVDIVLIN